MILYCSITLLLYYSITLSIWGRQSAVDREFVYIVERPRPAQAHTALQGWRPRLPMRRPWLLPPRRQCEVQPIHSFRGAGQYPGLSVDLISIHITWLLFLPEAAGRWGRRASGRRAAGGRAAATACASLWRQDAPIRRQDAVICCQDAPICCQDAPIWCQDALNWRHDALNWR